MKKSADSKCLTGPSIRGQLAHKHKHNGVIVTTFWYDNTVTRTDGWGHWYDYEITTQQEQKELWQQCIERGYFPMIKYQLHLNTEDTFKKDMRGIK